MSSHSDMLHAFHSLASVCVANHRHGPMLLPWLSSSRKKFAKPDLQVQLCPRWMTKAMERCKGICIAAKRSASDNIQRQRIISKIFSHVGHPSAKDILSRNAYRLVNVFVIVQSGKHFWENGMNQGKLERRPVVIVTSCRKAGKYKTLIRKAWTMARQKEHPNPASYHIL